MPLGKTKVVMTKSVDDKVAGRKYWLPSEKADAWILKGYCEGKLSRVFSPEDRSAILSNSQTVRL